ncbi:circumsporozoite protein-like [Eurosta solidaginis]|uniref:circumsporozoite protein-like n=1 Tax=Eurosta solidaginis TaxID=178769 RepID=UPI003530706B
MRTLFLVALICGVLVLMLQSTNASPPTQMSPQKGGDSSGRARRAANGAGGGAGGEAGGKAGADGGFDFNMGAGVRGKAGDGRGGK